MLCPHKSTNLILFYFHKPRKQNQTIQNKNHGLKLLFDTGAAAHVCPSWFGEQYPIYSDPNLKVQGADGTEIQVHGLRTVYFKMIPDGAHPIAITFIVCDVHQPILSFSQLFKQGCTCTMNQEKMYLDFGDLKVPLEQEAEHFYIYTQKAS